MHKHLEQMNFLCHLILMLDLRRHFHLQSYLVMYVETITTPGGIIIAYNIKKMKYITSLKLWLKLCLYLKQHILL